MTQIDNAKVISDFMRNKLNDDLITGENYKNKLINALRLIEQEKPKEKSKGILGFLSGGSSESDEINDTELLGYNGHFERRVAKQIYLDLNNNANDIHLVVNNQIIFFKNSIIHIVNLDGETSIVDVPKNDISSLFDYYVDYQDSGTIVMNFANFDYYPMDGIYFANAGNSETVSEFENLINIFKILHQEKMAADFSEHKSEVFNNLPIDQNGKLVLLDCNDFNLLLKNHQNEIITIDKTYIQKFVKTSNFLKDKKENITIIFSALSDAEESDELDSFFEQLREEIYFYNLVLLHALNMITALIDQDMIGFYETYEVFDKFEIFENNWEKDTRSKLAQISDGIETTNEILSAIFQQNQRMEARIVGAINNLTTISTSGFASIEDKLTRVNSTLKINTIINAVQAYQTYRLRKN